MLNPGRWSAMSVYKMPEWVLCCVMLVNGSKTVKPGWVCEDKLSLLIKCINGVRLVKPLTVQSSSWPSCGRIVFTDRRRGKGGYLAP